jgi:hypothetical protein
MRTESPTPRSRYIVKSIVHACAILTSFRSAGEVLRLRDVVARTGLSKGMCFRLLYTLDAFARGEARGGAATGSSFEGRRRRLG